MTTKKRLVFCGGGTAGHIFPNLALIEQLKEEFQIHYIGGKNGMEKDIISKINYITYHEVSTVKLIRSLSPKNLAIPFKLFKGVSEAKKLLKQINPALVFSKGGFVALPTAMAARCPLLCHESDFKPGLANRLVKNKCAQIFTSFPETASVLKNGVFSGAPIRQALYKERAVTPRPVLLIMGGSLGAKAINELIAANIDSLFERFEIVHLTGRGKATDITAKHYTQMEFCDNMGELYAKTAVALSRGGGSALFELAALKIPSLIIPLPKGVSRGDQIDNAHSFAKRDLCRVVEENCLSSINLRDELSGLMRDKKIRTALNSAQNIDGTAKIVAQIRKIALDT